MNATTIELLEWIADRPRTYGEAMSAWTSNCPRHPAWDDAVSDGLVAVRGGEVVVTPQGQSVLKERVDD